MITKTDYEMLLDLNRKYEPKRRGFCNNEECLLIKSELQIKERDILSLRNLRNTAVLYFSDEQDPDKLIEKMDKMGAVCSIIDSRLFNLGYLV